LNGSTLGSDLSQNQAKGSQPDYYDKLYPNEPEKANDYRSKDMAAHFYPELIVEDVYTKLARENNWTSQEIDELRRTDFNNKKNPLDHLDPEEKDEIELNYYGKVFSELIKGKNIEEQEKVIRERMNEDAGRGFFPAAITEDYFSILEKERNRNKTKEWSLRGKERVSLLDERELSQLNDHNDYYARENFFKHGDSGGVKSLTLFVKGLEAEKQRKADKRNVGSDEKSTLEADNQVSQPKELTAKQVILDEQGIPKDNQKAAKEPKQAPEAERQVSQPKVEGPNQAPEAKNQVTQNNAKANEAIKFEFNVAKGPGMVEKAVSTIRSSIQRAHSSVQNNINKIKTQASETFRRVFNEKSQVQQQREIVK